jgi:hypothetical protein
VEFDLGRLREWIDNALVDEGDRGENIGKRPVYRYSYRHYRRVLQVLRRYARGIKGRDEILIMLFLNGHGVKPFEVRELIAQELLTHGPSSMLSCGRHGSMRKGKFHPSTRRAWFAALDRVTNDSSKQESFFLPTK